MSDKVIVYQRPDGGCSIIHPAPEMFDPNSFSRQELEKLGTTFNTDDEVVQYLTKDVPQDALSHRITTINNLPDRTFRNAWTDEHATETVDINMDKAYDIHKDKLRELRRPLLEKLDVEYMKADEENDDKTKSSIIAQKQALRNVTQLPSGLDTPSLLAAYIPDILKD